METANKEMLPISEKMCCGCQYFYGMTGGDFRNGARNSGKSYPMCSYYIDTGKHRMDDFGKERKHNEWLMCNKYEKKYKERDKKLKPMTISAKGKELSEKRREELREEKEKPMNNEIGVQNVCICQNCGSDKLGTSDSRDMNGRRIRTRYCKVCGFRFRTIEIPLDMYMEGKGINNGVI